MKTRDIDIIKKLSEFSKTYKKYRTLKHVDYDLDFAVKCGTEDLYNRYKHLDKKYILQSIEAEINDYIEDIEELNKKKMAKFETGKSYYGRSVCDHNCVWNVEILNRTEKSVRIKEPMTGNIVRKKIYISYDNTSEFIYPNGIYSMAVMISADKEVI